ncbi:MAG TPA: DsbE family thiol:disulfide interchange protein [Gammaproteobacteria bacterium]|nr:DsbE family thiol:disulfide interchange protein [Gammaproteobacteria bacterium]
MWKFAIPLVLLVVIGVFFYRGLKLDPSDVPSALLDRPIPEFSLPSLADPDRSIGSRDLKGKVTLLNVWATWCIECRHEHGYLLQLARMGVPIYGFNLKDDRASALDWLASLGNPYVATAVDADGTAALDWGITAAPETFLIGRDGKVLFKHISPMTAAVWQRDFLPVLERECTDADCPFLAAAGGK